MIAFALALGAAGCAINPVADISAFAQDTGANSFEIINAEVQTDAALVLPVVHDRQTQGPSCGAHAVAAVINYWQGPAKISGDALYADTPPANAAGYSLAELMQIANAHGLQSSAVRLTNALIIDELERGRPVIAPVRVPAVYVQGRLPPGAGVPVLSTVRNSVLGGMASAAEISNSGLRDHYVTIVGYDEGKFVVVEPIMGYRTISMARLERYRSAFGDAALVISAAAGRGGG